MQVLVLNPGSATLKYRLVSLQGESPQTLTQGVVEHVTGDSTTQAAATVLSRCQTMGVQAVGCRVVHGGHHFSEPTLVTPEVVARIRELGRLAPLHNPIAADVLDAIGQQLPGVPIVTVFDTAFHRSIPEYAGLYAVPLSLSREKALRRYGFHGTSHQYVSRRLIARLGRGTAGTRVITCHLGNGASLCAVRDGKSIDTSMGLTPLEGLVMGTRSGDVDPGLVLHLLRHERMTVDEVDELLNKKSGLLGVGGHGDMRDLQSAIDAGDANATLALEMFCYRIRKYIGAYAAALEGVDAIAFTGGIGEHSATVREKVCGPLAWMGVRLDDGINHQPGKGEVCLSTGPTQVWVIPTDEESLIAQATAEKVGRR